MMSKYESPSKWNKSVASLSMEILELPGLVIGLFLVSFLTWNALNTMGSLVQAFLVGHLILTNIMFVSLAICIFEVLDDYHGFDWELPLVFTGNDNSGSL